MNWMNRLYPHIIHRGFKWAIMKPVNLIQEENVDNILNNIFGEA